MDDPQAQQARTHQLPPLQEPSRGDHGPPSDAWSHVRFEGSMRFTRRFGSGPQMLRLDVGSETTLDNPPSPPPFEASSSGHTPAALRRTRTSSEVPARRSYCRRDRCNTHATQHTGLEPQRTRHHSRGVVELGFTPSRRFASSRMAADSYKTMPTNGFHERPWEENERAARCHTLNHR